MMSPLSERTIASLADLHLDHIKNTPTFMGIPVEVRKQILIYLLTGSTMIDVTKTERGCKQRRRGLQSILIVNKQLRKEGAEAFFEATTFTVSHFQLHSKFKRMNKFSTLEAVQNLYINWAAPTSYAFTTIHAEAKLVLALQRLKKVTINCKAPQYREVKIGQILYHGPTKFLRPNVQDWMVETTINSVDQFPRWLKQILQNKERKFTVNLIVYFLCPAWKDLFAVTINWDEKAFMDIEGYPLTLYETEREGVTVPKSDRPKWKRGTQNHNGNTNTNAIAWAQTQCIVA